MPMYISVLIDFELKKLVLYCDDKQRSDMEYMKGKAIAYITMEGQLWLNIWCSICMNDVYETED